MNCFPCRGPACNGCGKFDRIKAAVEEGGAVSCSACGGSVDLSSGRCERCGAQVIKPPGTRQGG